MTNHKDCIYNTSKSSTFDGYCFLPKYKTEKAQLLIPCGKCPCDDFELR